MIRNRVTEKDICVWLEKNGFQPDGYSIKHVELHAIERPGWVQIFRFELLQRNVEPSDDGFENEGRVGLEQPSMSDRITDRDTRCWFGVAEEDERIRNVAQRTKVELFATETEQQHRLDELSAGKIRRRQVESKFGIWLVMAAIITILIINLIGNLFGDGSIAR